MTLKNGTEPLLINASILNHTPGKVPYHKPIGIALDALLIKHFLGKKVVVRCIGSQDHPTISLDELTDIILKTGTDKYDNKRRGVGYDEFIHKGINVDFYGEPVEITAKTAIIAQLVWEMHHSAIGDRGYGVHVDVVIIYDAEKVDMVMSLYESHPTSDGFVFKDSSSKRAALLGIIKIST